MTTAGMLLATAPDLAASGADVNRGLGVGAAIVVAIAGPAIGTVVGILLQRYIPLAFDRKRARRRGTEKLLGTTWTAAWYESKSGQPDSLFVEDTIVFTEMRGEEITAVGNGSAGRYVLKGHINGHGVLVMTYNSSPDSKFDGTGTLVLRKDINYREMDGYWSGFTTGNRVVGGPARFINTAPDAATDP